MCLQRVLRTYLEDHYAIGDPCRALYMSFADQQEKSVQEPQNLLHPEPDTQSSAILSSWVTHAQVILANRTGDTNKVRMHTRGLVCACASGGLHGARGRSCAADSH